MKASRTKVVVAGNIAAGKTTLCRQLQVDMPALELFEEKIVSLQALPSFYEEMAAHPGQPNKFAYDLQLEFLELRFQNELRADRTTAPLAVMDRSIYEDRHVFAEALKEEGAFPLDQFAAYTQAYDTRSEKVVPPTFFIYLRTTTPTLLERIQARHREFEKQITAAYLDNLTKHYNAFFANLETLVPQARVAIIDTDGRTISQIAEEVWRQLHELSGE